MGGCIDEVSVYNITLSATEAQELFNDGVALDATTHSKKDYLVGYWRNDGVSSWVDRGDIQAIGFDGTDDYITMTGLALGDTFSVSAWVYFNIDASSSDFDYIISFGASGTRTHFSLGRFQDGTFYYYDGSSSKQSTSFTFSTGTWTHVLATVQPTSNRVKLYINGEEQAVAQPDGDFNISSSTQAIGRYQVSSTHYMNGLVSQVAIWNSTLTASDVSSIYALGRKNVDLSVSYPTNLVGYWMLNPSHSSPDLTGSNKILDRSTNSNHGTQSGTVGFLGVNNGTPAGTPESITIREGLNLNKDGLGFPFRFDNSNVLRLDGVNDFVEVDYPAMSDQINSGIYTFDFWVKHNKENTSTTETYICLRDNDSASNRFKIQKISVADNASYPILRYAVEGGGDITYNSSLVDTLDEGGWFYIAFVSSGVASRQFYYAKSGADSLTAVTANTSTYGNTNVWDEIHIGQKREGTGALGLEMLNGVIDEVRYYSKALSSTELLKNYKHGKSKHKN